MSDLGILPLIAAGALLSRKKKKKAKKKAKKQLAAQQAQEKAEQAEAEKVAAQEKAAQVAQEKAEAEAIKRDKDEEQAEYRRLQLGRPALNPLTRQKSPIINHTKDGKPIVAYTRTGVPILGLVLPESVPVMPPKKTRYVAKNGKVVKEAIVEKEEPEQTLETFYEDNKNMIYLAGALALGYYLFRK